MSYHPPKPDEHGAPSHPPPGMPISSPSTAQVQAQVQAPVQDAGDLVAPDPETLRFVNELSAAGLLGDLDGDELRRLLGARSEREGSRHLDMLTSYYGGAGDDARAHRRCTSDRFFLLSDEDETNGKAIATELARLSPEIDEVSMERIGSDDGPLILRCGDHVAAIVDEYEESLDTDEIDLRALDDRASVTAQSIVQAINALLDRYGVDRRFVPLLGDVSREAYVAVTESGAIELCRAGFLDLDTKAEVIEHCAFGA